jgi:serine/threonine-protein kinase
MGAGGMGEVYRARDTKLKRDVALKVLPEAFAKDPGRMLRFQREAEVLALLNHPNIAHIYGVEERALVMELVEGESPKGPMPFDDAWKIALQIAEALEYAHEKGVVHRDLKPANIKVTPAGVVKLLDFGLAKAFSDTPDANSADPENSPTITLGATVAGTVLGTAAYMSPEQAKGKKVDKRADIWSWGVVLYELLTGERLFKGDEAADTLAQVLTKEPDPERVPRQVQRLLARCLEKDPKRRLRDIGEARYLLDEPAAPLTIAPRWSRIGFVIAAGMTIVAAGLAWIAWRATRPVEHPLVRLDVDLGPDISLPPPDNNGPSVVISPDGNRIAYIASVSGGPNKLFTRRLDQKPATEVPGTEGATSPFFSRDSQWIAFSTTASGLKKVSVDGGVVVSVGSFPVGAGTTWSWGEDGTIIASRILGEGLTRIGPSGGTPERLTELAKGELIHAFPQILPEGKAALFVAYSSDKGISGDIEVLALASRQRKVLLKGSTSPRYLPTGHLIYTTEGTLRAVPFDLDKLEIRGTPVPILDDVAHAAVQSKAAQFEVSTTGVLVYRRAKDWQREPVTLQWLESSGKTRALTAKPGIYSQPRFSPNGEKLALVVSEPSGLGAWVYEWRRDRLWRLTSRPQDQNGIVWTPNGEYTVFGSLGNGMSWTRPDRPGQVQPLTQSNNLQIPFSFSPNGRLAYMELEGGRTRIYTVGVDDDGTRLRAGKPELFRETQTNDNAPTFSPDGRWLAYVSNETGNQEVHVQAFPSGPAWTISNGGGEAPVWSRNSQELFYQSGDKIMVVSYTVKGDTLELGNPRVWAAKLGGVQPRQWDLAPDGKRLLVLTPVASTEAPKPDHEVTFLLNFFDYLRQRVPVNK